MDDSEDDLFSEIQSSVFDVDDYSPVEEKAFQDQVLVEPDNQTCITHRFRGFFAGISFKKIDDSNGLYVYNIYIENTCISFECYLDEDITSSPHPLLYILTSVELSKDEKSQNVLVYSQEFINLLLPHSLHKHENCFLIALPDGCLYVLASLDNHLSNHLLLDLEESIFKIHSLSPRSGQLLILLGCQGRIAVISISSQTKSLNVSLFRLPVEGEVVQSLALPRRPSSEDCRPWQLAVIVVDAADDYSLWLVKVTNLDDQVNCDWLEMTHGVCRLTNTQERVFSEDIWGNRKSLATMIMASKPGNTSRTISIDPINCLQDLASLNKKLASLYPMNHLLEGYLDQMNTACQLRSLTSERNLEVKITVAPNGGRYDLQVQVINQLKDNIMDRQLWHLIVDIQPDNNTSDLHISINKPFEALSPGSSDTLRLQNMLSYFPSLNSSLQFNFVVRVYLLLSLPNRNESHLGLKAQPPFTIMLHRQHLTCLHFVGQGQASLTTLSAASSPLDCHFRPHLWTLLLRDNQTTSHSSPGYLITIDFRRKFLAFVEDCLPQGPHLITDNPPVRLAVFQGAAHISLQCVTSHCQSNMARLLVRSNCMLLALAVSTEIRRLIKEKASKKLQKIYVDDVKQDFVLLQSAYWKLICLPVEPLKTNKDLIDRIQILLTVHSLVRSLISVKSSV